MIYGIGIDLVDTRRIKRGLDRFGARLARKILSDAEFREFEAHNNPVYYLAKHFAAKEAAAKALGTGFRNGIAMRQISVNHNPAGQPVLEFNGAFSGLIASLDVHNSFLSLSDEREFACACVVLEK